MKKNKKLLMKVNLKLKKKSNKFKKKIIKLKLS